MRSLGTACRRCRLPERCAICSSSLFGARSQRLRPFSAHGRVCISGASRSSLWQALPRATGGRQTAARAESDRSNGQFEPGPTGRIPVPLADDDGEEPEIVGERRRVPMPWDNAQDWQPVDESKWDIPDAEVLPSDSEAEGGDGGEPPELADVHAHEPLIADFTVRACILSAPFVRNYAALQNWAAEQPGKGWYAHGTSTACNAFVASAVPLSNDVCAACCFS